MMGIMKRQDSPTPEAAEAVAGVDYESIKAVVACAIVMSIVATAVVWIRISIRRSRGRCAAEDWFILACMPFMYALAITALMAVYRGGLGYPFLELLATDPSILPRSLQCLFSMEIVYANLITLIKLSVLAMYRNIFPTSFVNMGTYILGATVILWYLGVILVTFLQCRPLTGVWDFSGTIEPVCMDKLGLFLGNAIPNIIIDVFILALPLYEVARLQMTKVKKTGVLIIFLLGGVTIIISGFRLNSGLMVLAPGNTDFTRMVGPLWAWTVVEPAMGIVCACLPTVGGPVVGMVVRLMTTPKPTERNESTGVKGSFKTIGTARGSSPKAINRPSLPKSRGSFERLNDESGEPSPTGLWPRGYHGERETTVSGRRSPSDKGSDIPLTSISIRQEMSWTESKAAAEVGQN